MAEKKEFAGLKALPPVSMSMTDTRWNRTGDWSFFEPLHTEKISPCATDCPVGEPIHQYLHLVHEERFHEAWEMIMAVNPMPAVCGRVCYHRCESQCNRGELDAVLNIHSVERFLGDLAIESDWSINQPAKKIGGEPVAIVGSGPAGLSCAYHLRLLGYSVVVYERESQPGGMLRVGVPGYRLPRKILDAEIARLEKMGIEIRCGEAVTDIERLADGARAVFLATGAHGSRNPGVDGLDKTGVRFGLDFLKDYNAGKSPETGGRVAVIGGGNTAIDVARAGRRLGAQVDVLYRRTEEEMPAHAEEVDQARQEGVQFHFQVAPTEVTGNGVATGLTLQRMQQGKPDESGRRRPEPISGSEFQVDAGCVVFAIGEAPELDYLAQQGERDGARLRVDSLGATSISGVFAGGDIRSGSENTVTHGLADGRVAARNIHNFIMGKNQPAAQETETQVVGFSQINTDYFDKAARLENPVVTGDAPPDNGAELDRTFTVDEVKREAARCFNCGTCIHCDNCVIFCPDLAVSCVDGQYKVNKDYCKGCGICVEECPRYIITMEKKR